MRRVVPTLIAALVLLASVVRAQSGTLTGTVLDATTRQPIEGVTIEIRGSVLSASSRANGRYTILSVPPGIYTVSARKLGYSGRDVSNVILRADDATTLHFELDSAPALATVRVETNAPPPVDLRAVGSAMTLTGEEMRALPAVDLAELLMLAPGFAVLGDGANLQSLASQRRGDATQVSVRGGRPGATVQLLDGIPINHPIFGSTAFDVSPLMLSSLTLSAGYMEAQYSGGVAGVVNMTLREGEERLRGHLDYQSSGPAGVFGSGADAVLNSQHMRGVLSGPLGSDRLRFVLAGQFRRARDRAVQFPLPGGSVGVPSLGFTGWHGFGAVEDDQYVAKVTFTPTPTLKLGLTGLSSDRRTLAYDRRFLGVYREEALSSAPIEGQPNPYASLIQASVAQTAHFVSLRAEQRFDMATIAVTHAQLGGDRRTCNVFVGVCLADRFWRPTRTTNGLFMPFESPESPVTGTAPHYGGESYTSSITRADVIMQAADHVRLQAGLQHTAHRLTFREVGQLTGTVGAPRNVTNQYRTRPVESAVYVQSNFDYDFLLATVGVRYEHGASLGSGFVRPRLATNGTTAVDVCTGNAPGINTTPFTSGNVTGLGACLRAPFAPNGLPWLLDSAARLAATDDFRSVAARRQFAPRIGVSFPLGERSALFMNAGSYTKHPYYHDAYSNTALGSRAGFGAGTDDLCAAEMRRPGADECRPNLAFHREQAEYVGNPGVSNEAATTVELGFSALLGRVHGVNVTLFSTEQGALTGFVNSDVFEDVGLTYAPIERLEYATIENRDFVTSRGVSVGVRRQLTGIVGYTLNYTWSQATEVGLPPEIAADAGASIPRLERRSPRDRPHAVNAALFVQFGNAGAPRLGRLGTLLFRDSRVALTAFWSRGPSAGQLFEGTAVVGGSPVSIETAADRPANPVNLAITKDIGRGALRYSVFVRAMNLFNSEACCGGLSTLEERRAIAAGLPGSQPDQRLQFRSIFAGVVGRF